MSAQAIDILVLSVQADVAVSANTFVTVAGAPATADANTLGVARTDAASGNELAVTVLGTATVIAGGTLAAGDPVSSDANAKAVKTDGTTFTQTVGRALAAASAGDAVEVLLIAN